MARAHPLYGLLAADPFVREAREARHPLLAEPHLLDYLYGCLRQRRSLATAGPVGSRVFAFNATTRRSRAIRRLRLALAEEVADIISQTRATRIAAITCGHLRELDAIPWHAGQDVEAFLAIDRSNDITSRVRHMPLHEAIKAISSPVWEVAHLGIVLNGYRQAAFNLIYSIGALDASDDAIAERLLETASDALAPGGRLVLVNSRPLTTDIAFQEAFLDQRPFSRNRTDIDFLLRHIRGQREFSIRIEDAEADEFTRITVERHKLC